MVESPKFQTVEVDIAILGGGLAGLSLAAELAAPEFSTLKVIVIEPRESYVRDKTWSYWRQSPHAFSFLESAVWQSWQVQNICKAVKTDSKDAGHYVYASINSDAFYKAALQKIGACKHVNLLQASTVDAVDLVATDSEKSLATVILNGDRQVLVKKAIFDSRPLLKKATSNLTQHFLGWHLIADSPVFDHHTVTLMDFNDGSHGVNFVYVLPYSPNDALIESTWICNHGHHEDYVQELNTYIARRWPDVNFEVKYIERGSLPLIISQSPTNLRHKFWLKKQPKNTLLIIPIGTRAGTQRAATGYAFLETLADSIRIAGLIKKNQPLTAFKRNKIDTMMDYLFLSFIGRHPNAAANYFVQMFANCPPVRLIRFLTGQSTLRDKLSVICAVPTLPMLKHLLFGWWLGK